MNRNPSIRSSTHCRRHALFALAVLLTSAALAADELPATLLTQRGKLLLSEDLAQAPAEVKTGGGLNDLKSGWYFHHGTWDFVDGAVKGGQVAADHHSANAFCAVRFKDAVIQFDARLDGARQLCLCVDDPPAMRPPTPTRPAAVSVEHLCRVIINADGFATQKDDHDHDGPDQAVPFGSVKMPIKPGEWKTVLVEIRGDEMVTTIDSQSIAGAHPLVAADKAYISFNVTGASGSFRKLRIWEALPNKDWPKTKAKLTTAK